MQNKLSQIFNIKEFLDQIKYPDSKRIAIEIVEYLEENSTDNESVLRRLQDGEPWEYIRGYAQFCNSKFLVTEDTLIPRIETEQLVYNSIELIKRYNIENIVDIGTGSGCIAISLKKLLNRESIFPNIFATEISSNALKIAKENEKLLTNESIEWIKTDLIEDLPILKGTTLLIANLPYIPTSVYKKLDKSVLDFEPKLALDGGSSGLEIYERLLEQIKKKCIKDFILYIETEETIVEETFTLFKKYLPNLKHTVETDCFNKERFILSI